MFLVNLEVICHVFSIVVQYNRKNMQIVATNVCSITW